MARADVDACLPVTASDSPKRECETPASVCCGRLCNQYALSTRLHTLRVRDRTSRPGFRSVKSAVAIRRSTTLDEVAFGAEHPHGARNSRLQSPVSSAAVRAGPRDRAATTATALRFGTGSAGSLHDRPTARPGDFSTPNRALATPRAARHEAIASKVQTGRQ
jgi:hypothetical protein